MLSVVGKGRAFATFNQLDNSFSVALGIPKKLDAELVVFVPAHDGDLDGKRRLCFSSIDVQRKVAPRSQGHVALHSASRCGEIEEGPFSSTVVGLDAGGIPHIHSWAAPKLHINLTASACIGQAGKNLKEVGWNFSSRDSRLDVPGSICIVRKLAWWRTDR